MFGFDNKLDFFKPIFLKWTYLPSCNNFRVPMSQKLYYL